MKRRLKFTIYAIIISIFLLLFMQLMWIHHIYNEEKKRIALLSTSLLESDLTIEIGQKNMDEAQKLMDGVANTRNGVWGANFEEKTIIVKITAPDSQKIVRHCKTDEEWYKYTKTTFGLYQISGMNLTRLDSLFKISLNRYSINLPYVLEKIDKKNNIVEYPSNITIYSYKHYNIHSDTIPLGIDDKDFIVAKFDDSYYGMFQQMRIILFVSIALFLILVTLLFFFVNTIFYQQKLSKIREDFVNSMTHELKSPLVLVKRSLEYVNSNKQDYINIVMLKCDKMFMLINRLLASSSNKESLKLSLQSFKIYPFMENIINQYKILEKNHINIQLLYEKSVSDTILADKLHLENAITNLIDNSIKYSEKTPDIFVRCYEENACICISVKDRGIGIPKEYMRFLFQKSFRVPEKKSLKRTGFGLGLHYVKMVAKSHGGDVKVHSKYKEGSEFIITLPNNQ